MNARQLIHPSTLPMPFGWFGVAYSNELAAGELKRLHYFGREWVMFRDVSGAAAVMDAYCPHLGAHLGHGGRVQNGHVICPFHAWEFDSRGHCVNVPYAKQIPPKIAGKPCLPRLPTCEVNGTIFAWWHPEGEAPSFEVENLPEFSSEEWTEPLLFEWTFKAAIQETSENGVDSAHFTYVHSAQDVPVGRIEYADHQRHAYFESRAPAMDKDGNLDTTGTKWRDNQLQTSCNGPGQTWQRFTGLFETLMQGLVTPVDQESVHLRFAFVQRRDQHESQSVMATALMQEITRQVEQDIPIWENKVYRPEPVLCDGDGPIAKHRKWFQRFYA